MSVMNLRSYSPPPKKPTPRELLDELVRTGHRPYICGEPGFGVVIVWATSEYVEEDLAGEEGFKVEVWGRRWVIPTEGLVPDVDASIQRIKKAAKCNKIKQAPITPALEGLISSSVQLITDDLGRMSLKPLGEPVRAKT